MSPPIQGRCLQLTTILVLAVAALVAGAAVALSASSLSGNAESKVACLCFCGCRNGERKTIWFVISFHMYVFLLSCFNSDFPAELATEVEALKEEMHALKVAMKTLFPCSVGAFKLPFSMDRTLLWLLPFQRHSKDLAGGSPVLC